MGTTVMGVLGAMLWTSRGRTSWTVQLQGRWQGREHQAQGTWLSACQGVVDASPGWDCTATTTVTCFLCTRIWALKRTLPERTL